MEFLKELPWTAILTAVIIVVTFLFNRLYRRTIRPYIEQAGLVDAAMIAVEAAEALYGRGHGEEKLKCAIDQLKADGWNVETNEVLNAISAAWQELDIKQIAAGIKEAADG